MIQITHTICCLVCVTCVYFADPCEIIQFQAKVIECQRKNSIDKVIQKEFGVPFILSACVGARVMLRKNKTPTLANGSTGTVKALSDSDGSISVLCDNGETHVFRYELFKSTENDVIVRQLPLCLAYAFTAHKVPS